MTFFQQYATDKYYEDLTRRTTDDYYDDIEFYDDEERKKLMEKKNFYFTYGTDPEFPFRYGWTRVVAEDIETAITLFQMVHPNREKSNCVNCAFYYDEKFEETDMYKGVFGTDYEHEVIELVVKEMRK